MTFVFTSWYIVLAALLVAVIGCIVAFVLMDKKDKVIINEFVNEANKGSQKQEVEAQPETESENKE